MNNPTKSNKESIEMYDYFELLGMQNISLESKKLLFEELSELILREFILDNVKATNDKNVSSLFQSYIDGNKDSKEIIAYLSSRTPTFFDDLISFTNEKKKEYILNTIQNKIQNINQIMELTTDEDEVFQSKTEYLFYSEAEKLCKKNLWSELRSHMNSLPSNKIGEMYLAPIKIDE